jgi:hypothetical protein
VQPWKREKQITWVRGLSARAESFLAIDSWLHPSPNPSQREGNPDATHDEGEYIVVGFGESGDKIVIRDPPACEGAFKFMRP